jgi:hypothetical protein
MKTFAVLFKKYRLRAEFDTISSFSDALAEKGYFYEESIFSHWQKGTRLPSSRDVVLKLIAIFNERGVMESLHEANDFLESAKHGYLTDKEQEELHFSQEHLSLFQAPRETTLPMKRGYLLRNKFLDGVRGLKREIFWISSGLIILTIVTTAAFGAFTPKTTIFYAEKATNETFTKQATESLSNIVESTAKEQDTIFENIRVDVTNLASYTSNIYDNPSVFNNNTYWRFDDRVFQKDGQYLNNKEDMSTFHIPSFVVLDEKEKQAIELTANLDFIVPSILHTNPNIAAMYTIDSKGVTRYFPNIILGSLAPPDYDPRKDIYYKPATPEENPQNKVVWSPLYEDVAGRGLMITASAPIYTNNGFEGIAGVDVLLNNIIKMINEYKPIDGSYAFLVDKEGNTIAFPEKAQKDLLGRHLKKDEVRVKLLSNKLAPEFSAVLTKMMKGAKGVGTFKSGDKELFIGYAPLKLTGFSLAVVVEKEAMFKAVAEHHTE